MEDNAKNKELTPEDITEKLQGKWYEQRKGGAVITIEKEHITYEEDGESTGSGFCVRKTENGYNEWDIWTAAGFKTRWSGYEKLTYCYYEDLDEGEIMTRLAMVVYDMKYTPRQFRRDPYKAPEYGEVHINTNEKAIKWFQDYRVRKLSLKVQVPFKESTGMMAPMPPYQGYYTFDIERTEDGGGIIKAVMDKGGCAPGSVNPGMLGGMMMAGMQDRGFKVPDVVMTPEEMNDLALCIANGKLDQINGLDAWQDGVPSGTESFDLSIQFYKESYHARANHIFVPEEWVKDGYRLHIFILKILVKAGLDYGRMEFHSTKPMLRIKSSKKFDGYSIKLSGTGSEDETIKLKGEAYDYETSIDVGVWRFTGNVSEPLKASLNAMMEQINKEEKARGMWLHEAMAKIPKEVRDADRPPFYASRYMGDFRIDCSEKYFLFWLTRAEQYSPEVEGGLQNTDPFGDHRTYCYSTADGHLMCAAEFYTDTEKLIDKLIEKAAKNHSSGKTHEKLVSPAYREVLRKRLTTPESLGGMGFEPNSTGMMFRFISDLDESRGVWITEYTVPYDESQDFINPEYAVMEASQNSMPYYGMLFK